MGGLTSPGPRIICRLRPDRALPRPRSSFRHHLRAEGFPALDLLLVELPACSRGSWPAARLIPAPAGFTACATAAHSSLRSRLCARRAPSSSSCLFLFSPRCGTRRRCCRRRDRRRAHSAGSPPAGAYGTAFSVLAGDWLRPPRASSRFGSRGARRRGAWCGRCARWSRARRAQPRAAGSTGFTQRTQLTIAAKKTSPFAWCGEAGVAGGAR